MRMQIEGVFLDGISAKRQQALLTADINGDSGSVDLVDVPSQRFPISLSSLVFESRLGNTPREISLGEGRLFLCEHSSDVEAIEALTQSSNVSLVHQMESRISWVAVSLVVTIVFIWAVMTYGIPATAKAIAFNMPELISDQFGGTLGVLDSTVLDESELGVDEQERLRVFLVPYNRSVSSQHPSLEFRQGLQANAFALPGGEIILTDGLVNLASNDQELLAVYFHELGHLQHRHIVRRAVQGSMLAVFAVLISSDVSNIDLLAGLPALLMDLSYSRQFEIEADEFALQQMQEHRIDVEHFAAIMNKLEAFYRDEANSVLSDEIPNFLSTHPNTEQRVELIKQYR